MAEKRASLIVELKDLATAGLEKFKGTLQSLEENVVKLGVSFAAMSAFVSKAVREFGEQEAVALRLSLALKGTEKDAEGAAKKLELLANALSRQTGFADTAIMSMQNMLANLGFNSAAIEQLTPRVLNLARATGKDLSESALLLGKAIEMGANTPLRRAGVHMDDAALKARNFAGIMQAFDASVSPGLAKAFGGTTLGNIEKFRATMERLTENIGGALAKALNPVIAWFTRVAEVASNADPATLKLAATFTLLGTATLGALGALAAMSAVISPLTLGAVALLATFSLLATNTLRLRDVTFQTVSVLFEAYNVIQKMTTGDWAGGTEAVSKMSQSFAELKNTSSVTFDSMTKGAVNTYDTLRDLFSKGIPSPVGGGAPAGGGGTPNIPGAVKPFTDDEMSIKIAQMKGYHAQAELLQLQHELKMRGITDKSEQGQAILRTFYRQQTLSGMSSMFQNLSTLSKSKHKELAMVGKMAASGQALIAALLSANEARAALAGIPIIGPALGEAAAASAYIAGIANVATINGVEFAEGGMALPKPGGTFGRFAEAGNAEAVIPLDDPATKEKLRDTMGGAGVNVTIQAGTIIADRMSVREFAEKIDEELYKLGRTRKRLS